MSRTVDEKVVEMKFNNQNFEKNVNQSMNSIAKLKSNLDFKGTESKAANSMSKIASAANNMNLSGLSKAIDTVNYRFSTMGVVATNILNQITNSITGKLSGAFNMLFGQIKSGGLSRAMNLERANFQLRNLLKDEKEVEGVMKNVNDAVDGTAYGLDAAAVVASQLTASGARAGDQLYNQLRAIAGVAAMTGASYEEIGNIFTTVAGNGRLLSMQLLQLSSRGLNVAAIMSKQMNITEEEFRDKVSKSQITYQQFADAMVKEFGEAAGKANETFDGALSNVKAALSRIGAKFYSPGLIQARDILNEFRLAINAINKALDPLINSLNGTVYVLSKKIQSILKDITADVNDLSKDNNIVSFLDSATKAFSGFSDVVFGSSQTMTKDWWNSIKNSEVGTENFIFAIKKAAKEFDVDVDSMIKKKGSFENTFESGWFNVDILKGAINSFGTESDKLIRMYDYLESKGEDITDITSTQIKDIAKSLNIDDFSDDLVKKLIKIEEQSIESGKSVTDILKEINEAEKESNKQRLLSMGYTEEQINDLRNLYTEYINGNTKVLNDLTKGMDPTTFKGAIDYIIESLSSIASIFNSIFQYIVKAFKDDAFYEDSIILDIVAEVSDLLSNISTFFKTSANENNKLVRSFSGIIAVIKIVGSLIKSIISGISNIISGSNKLGGSVLDITAKIGDKLLVLYNFLRDTQIFDRITDIVVSIGRLVISVINGIVSVMSKIFSGDSKVFASFGKAVTSIFNAFFGANSKGIVKIINKITDVINGFSESISKKDGIISKIGDNLSTFFSNVAEGAKKLSNGFLKMDVLGLLTGGLLKIGVVAQQLYWRFISIKRFFDFIKNAGATLKTIPDAIHNFNNVLSQLGGALKQFQNDLKASVLLKTAAAIALLAGSLYFVSTIPTADLIKAGGAIALFAGMLLGATKVLTLISRTKSSPINWKKNGFINGLKQAIFEFKDIGKFAAKMRAIGNVMLKLAASVFIIAKAMKDIAEIVKDDPLVALGSIMILIGSIYALVGAVLALDKFGSKNISRLRAIGGLMLAMSVSVLLMAEAYKTIGDSIKGLDSNQIMYTTLIFFGSIAAMVLSILVLDAVCSATGSAKMLAIAAVVLSMATAILIMGAALALIATVVNNAGWKNTLIAAGIMIGMLFVLIGLIAALGAIAVAFSPLALLAVAGVLLTVAAVLLALSVAISVFSVALGVIITEIGVLTALLSSENCGAAWAALGYLATLLITLAVGLTAMTFGIVGVGVLLLLTEALKTLIPLLIALAALPSEDIWSGIGKIAQALLGFILVGMMATLLSPVLLTLSAVLTAVGISMTIASAAMYMFVSAFTGLSALTQVSSELIVSGMSKIADAIHNLVMNILDHVDEFIGKLHNTIVGSAPKIKEMIKSLIDIASSAINEHLPTILDAIKNAINIIAEKLHLEGVVQFIGSMAQVFNTFFGYIASMLQPIIDAGQNTTGSYLEGLTSMMDKIANAAVDIFVAFCTSLANVINERGDEIRDAGRQLTKAVLNAMSEPDADGESILSKAAKIGANLIDGFLSAFTGGRMTSAANAGMAIANVTLGAMTSKKGFDEHSPSKKAFKIGTYVIQGLVNGLKKTNDVYSAAAEVGNGVTSRIQESLSILEDYVNGEYVIEPVISPVLDMNGGLATASEISSMLSGTTSMSIAANVNARLNKNQNENPYGDITKAIGTLHNDLQGLEANNYTVNGLTYDDGSTVAVAVTDLIRATKVGRRM